MMKTYYFASLVILMLLAARCSLPAVQDIPWAGEYAIPLINSDITVDNLLGGLDSLNVNIDSIGNLSLFYEAELISEGINDVLPSIPSIGEVPILDTVSSFPLSASDNFIITKAIFSGDDMRFRYTHDKEETVEVTMRIPELSKDGEPFVFKHTLIAGNNLPYTEFTETIELEGLTYESAENVLTFRYDARNPDGERIKLTFAAMSFNELKFSYGEGSYERTSYRLEGDSIALNVLDNWQGGTLEFQDPRISFLISHSYGFPIAVEIEEVEVHTEGGEVKLLDGMLIQEEISLDSPSFSEVNTTKTTQITFTKDNSNINNLFNERVSFIDYDLSAIINPDGELSTKGYATDQSFFSVAAKAELPLEIKANELQFLDTINVEKLFPENFSEAEFKIVYANNYPLSMEFFFLFLDENNSTLERFLENEPLEIVPTQEKTRFINLESDVIKKIRGAKKIVVASKFSTANPYDDFVTLRASQALQLRVGLKFKL